MNDWSRRAFLGGVVGVALSRPAHAMGPALAAARWLVSTVVGSAVGWMVGRVLDRLVDGGNGAGAEKQASAHVVETWSAQPRNGSSHLAHCEVCRALADDLKAMASDMSRTLLISTLTCGKTCRRLSCPS